MALAVAATASPAGGVGFGPLEKSGLTTAPSKGFYLNLLNPYDQPRTFTITAHDADGTVSPRVRILPGTARLAAKRQRRILVIADGLVAGETYEFRVCARLASNGGEHFRANVCSNLSARRL